MKKYPSMRLCICLLGAFSGPYLPAEEPWTLGIEELYRLDMLPAFKRSIKVASQSSYDRTGGNNDGFSGKYSYVRKEPGGLVLLDLKGPGIIYRIWTPTPTDDTMEFYFDGEEKPRISVPYRDVFTGKREPFVRPLVGYGAGGFYSYLPLPFKKSCKILIKAERVLFYQINYALYPPEAPVKTFAATPSSAYLRHRAKAQKLFGSCGEDISAYGARAPGRTVVRTARIRLKPGATETLFATDEPGRIVGLRITPAGALAGKDRAILLRMYWDGETEPAVLCPAGDFFGYAWGAPATRSLLVGTAGTANYCYFPMPFDHSAKIELVSERTAGPPLDIQAAVVLDPTARTTREGKFYATWRRENPTTKGKPFTFIETHGTGHLVGCVQQSQGRETGNTYYFEGDDQTTIDGELVIHGTGSEDFYNGGWYDVPGRWERRRSFPLSGCLGYHKHLGRTGGYRFMIGDAYAYRKSILQTIEHAPTNNELINDYCGVTFLYSQKRPTCTFALPPAKDRAVVDPTKLIFATWWNVPIHAWTFTNKASLIRIEKKLDGKSVQLLSFQANGRDWVGDPFLSFFCDIPATGRYRISIEAAQGPKQGRVQLFLDEAAVGDAVDLAAEKQTLSEPRALGVLTLEEGQNPILMKIVGKPTAAPTLRLDLRNIICERID
jgi:hypothetical protein